ncbi:MAG: hypothetical protein Q4G49_09535, partial [Paracoccus sp. (in: a-proteobacteria)]|nr:hypothetical protein [Paracoccus sp. (in: a-proteobacteria)]
MIRHGPRHLQRSNSFKHRGFSLVPINPVLTSIGLETLSTRQKSAGQESVEMDKLDSIATRIGGVRAARHHGRVQAIRAGSISVSGLNGHASVGDRVVFSMASGSVGGEVIGLSQRHANILPERHVEGLSIGAPTELLFAPTIAPCESWIGRIIDPFGQPLDG